MAADAHPDKDILSSAPTRDAYEIVTLCRMPSRMPADKYPYWYIPIRLRMGLEWPQIRAQLDQLVAEARRAGLRQQDLADRGGLRNQSAISKAAKNPKSKYGPSVMTLVKTIEGLGITVTDFFAALEGHPPSERRLTRAPLAVVVDDPDAEADRLVGRALRKALRLASDVEHRPHKAVANRTRKSSRR